jgi:hypothetical protein
MYFVAIGYFLIKQEGKLIQMCVVQLCLHFPMFYVILVSHKQVNETVTVSFLVSIVSLHWELCKVCIEPERNVRKSRGISLRKIPWI